MRRVTRAGGVVAASVWDHAGGRGPLGVFWRAAHELDLEVIDESRLPGVREGHLAELFDEAGLRDIAATAMTVSREHPSFDDWWEPYTRGVGPAGAFVAQLDESQAGRASRAMPRAAPRGSVHADGACVDRSGSRLSGVDDLPEGGCTSSARRPRRQRSACARRIVSPEPSTSNPCSATRMRARSPTPCGRPADRDHLDVVRRCRAAAAGPRLTPEGTARSPRRSVKSPRAQRTPPQPIQAMATSSP